MNTIILIATVALAAALAASFVRNWQLRTEVRAQQRKVRRLKTERYRLESELVDLTKRMTAYDSLMLSTPGGLPARVNDCREVATAILHHSPHVLTADRTLLVRLQAIDELLTDLYLQMTKRQHAVLVHKVQPLVSPNIYRQLHQVHLAPTGSPCKGTARA